MTVTYTPPAQTSQYDLVNMHGAPLCHAIKCRKHTKLHRAYRGVFCPAHLLAIASIRERILHIPHEEATLEELQREVEALLRKIMEPGHMHYLAKLENRIKELSKARITK